MRSSSIDITQLALIRIILRNIEPKLDSLYTFLTVAANYKGKIAISQNTIANVLRMRNGSISKMFDQLSNLNLLAKDYTTTHGKQQVPTLLPVNKSALMIHMTNIHATGFDCMIEAIKEQSKGFSDKYLDLDGIKRQVAVDKLQRASETAPRKAYTRKNNSAPMKYGYMFEYNGLSEYYAANNCSPEGDENSEEVGNSLEEKQQKETIANKNLKTVSRHKRFLNLQHSIYKYLEVIEEVNKKEIDLYNLLTTKTTNCINHVINSEIETIPSTEPTSLTLPVLQSTPAVQSVVPPVNLEPCQSSTGLQGAIVKTNTTIPLPAPFPTRLQALKARFQEFNVHNASDEEKMAYCIYSYNRVVKLLPNLKQMQYPKALMRGNFELRSGLPDWMDNLCEFVNNDLWFELWTAALVRITKNSFLRDGMDGWKLNFPWLFTPWNLIDDEGEVHVFGDINLKEKVIGNDCCDPIWYMKYDDKDWSHPEMEAADVRLIGIDPWFKDNIEMFNCYYADPVEGTCPESMFHTPKDEYFVKQNGFQYMNDTD